MSVELTLHPNIKFHDGTPLTAPLAKDLLQRVLADQNAQAVSVSYASVTKVESKGEAGLVVHLARPEAFLLADLANSTIPHPNPERDELGTGPYKRVLAEAPEPAAQDAVNATRLEAFSDYYRGRPTVDFMEVRSYDEQRSAWAALMRGDIDAVHEVNPNAMDFVEAQTTVRPFAFVRPYYIALWFNVRHPVLRDSRVRQALSFAVDRQQLIDLGLNGRGVPADGPVWPYHWAYAPAERTYSLNRQAATLQLDAAGHSARSAGKANTMQSRFKFVCLTLANDARYEKLALLLQKQLYDIGVDMEIEALPLRELGLRQRAGRFDAILAERTSGRSLGWTYVSFHSRLTSVGYSAADAALDQMRAATTDNATREALNEFHRVLYDDPPAIFLAWPKVARAVRTNFVVPDEPGRDVMGSLRLWRPAETPR
jgi:peptide/nickel transport system substrate-binding protein